MSPESAIQAAQLMKKGVDLYAQSGRADSLVSYTKNCRVEPIVLIDERVAYLPFLGDILQTAHSIFAGYYLQAVSLDAVVGNVSVVSKIDKFNPTRSLGFEAIVPTVEDFKDGLPKLGVESSSNKNLQVIKDANNMAVGKMIEVDLTFNDQKVTLPIAIRLNTKTIDTQSLLHILGNSKDNKSATERYHGWKSGELQFWRDIVFAEDLIKAHRTTLAKDKSGVYAEMMRRRNNNEAKAVMSQELSVGTASAITVISDSTRKELEFQIGGKLSDFKTRQRVFDDCYMMLLFVVDAEFEHVTIYHRGLNMSTDMSLKEMKIANKNDGNMITDVLKAFISGHAPTF